MGETMMLSRHELYVIRLGDFRLNDELKPNDIVSLPVEVILDDRVMVTLGVPVPAYEINLIYSHEQEYVDERRAAFCSAADRRAKLLRITRRASNVN